MMLRLPFGRWAKRRQTRAIQADRRRRHTTSAQVSILEDRTLLAAPAMVGDLNTSFRTSSLGRPGELTAVGSRLFFTRQTVGGGTELFVSDGTDAGTRQVKDIAPGDAPSNPQELTAVGDELYFIATSPGFGYGLWKSDGTEAGTKLVKDVVPGPMGRQARELTNVNGTLFFRVDDQVLGSELWKSDGTAAGTVLVKDIDPGAASSYPRHLTNVNGILYFTAYNPVTGRELWRSDGTQAGTVLVKDIRPGSGESAIANITESNGFAFFRTYSEALGYELWKSDGTTAGTTLVRDIMPGPGNSYPKELVDVGGVLYFLADDGIHGEELWRTDGTSSGTRLVKDIVPGSRPSWLRQLIDFDGQLYFAEGNFLGGIGLLKSDGTEAGTVQFTNISGAVMGQFTILGEQLYFVSHSDVTGFELWKTDGTAAGTGIVKETLPGASGSVSQLTVMGDRVYFTADGGNSTVGLWTSDGTNEGTVQFKTYHRQNEGSEPRSMIEVNGVTYFIADGDLGAELYRLDPSGNAALVKDIRTNGGSVSSLFRFRDQLYLIAYDDAHGNMLWKSDGTEAGTVLVKDFFSAGSVGWINSTLVVGDTLYLITSGPDSEKLWVSDGTTAGTIQVTSSEIVRPSTKPLVSLNGVVYFSGVDSDLGHELWRSDGTAAGTFRVLDILPGPGSSSPKYLTSFNGTLYFSAFNNVGTELWKSDGTAAGTVLVKDVTPGGHSNPTRFTVVGNTLFFVASGPQQGEELWKTDGTAAGTVLVKDIWVGTSSSHPGELTSHNGQLFFTATTDGTHKSLWKSDGTTAGTEMVFPVGAFFFASPVSAGDALYFSSEDPLYGKELFRTDGTPAGTWLVANVEQHGDSRARPLAQIGNRLYFAAMTATTREELWWMTLDGAPTSLSLAAPALREDSAVGTVAGLFSSVGTAPTDALTYTLVAGVGDSGNASFTIVDNELRVAGPLDFETQPTHSIRVRVTNSSGSWTEDVFDIVIRDVNEAPTSIIHTLGIASLGENFLPVPPGFTGDIIVTDDDLGTNILGLSGPDAGYFSIVGTSLRFHATSLDYEIKPSYVVTITVDDPTVGGPVDASTTFTFLISDFDEYDVTLVSDIDPAPNSVPENSPGGTIVGLTAFASDADGSLNAITYSLLDNAGGRFVIHPATGVVSVAPGAVLNYEAATSHAIAVRARSADGSTSLHWFAIAVTDRLEPVTAAVDVDPGANQIRENSAGGSIVGVTIFASDPDDGPGGLTYSLVDAAGGRFWIHPTLGGVFVANGAVLDYEAATSHSITVKASSIDGTSSLTTVLINVLDSLADNQPGPRAPTLVKDLSTDNPGQIESTGGTFQAGSMLFFVTSLHSLDNYPDLHGSNLLVTYGETGGTFLLKEFSRGDIDFVGQINGSVLFSVDGDARNGKELWKTDGTPQGTIQIRDIFPGREGSFPYAPAKFQGVLYFRADDGVHGRELWRTDATQAGTFMVKDINPGPADSQPSNYWEVNGRLAFFASHAGSGREIWTTDGTEAGTTLLAETRPGTQSSTTEITKLSDGRFLFKKLESAIGEELWISDGTVAGTSLLKDIRPGAGSSFVGGIKVVGNRFYFTAVDETHGSELWVSDGTTSGTNLVKDIRPGSVDSSTGNLFAFGNTLYFTASSGVSGSEWWRTDGTEVGTVRLADVIPVIASMSASSMQVIGSTLYFGTNNGQFWKTDGTAPGTQKLADNIVFKGGQLLAGVLYFFNSTGLYRTDGTAAGTSNVATVNSQYPTLFTEDAIYFFNTDPSHGRELWKSDGTTAGTLMLKDVKPGPKSSYGEDIRYFNGKLYFSADSVAESPTERINRHWWVSDGTEAGTVQFNDSFGTRNRSSDPYYFTEMNGLLYFVNWTPTGVKIWKTDGTEAGTTTLPTPVFTGIRELTAVDGKLFFQGAVPATDLSGRENEELWVTDGTLAGTVRVKDIRPGTAGSYPRSLTGHGGMLYFNANDGTGGYQLWQSDGTAAGTVKVPTSEGGSVELVSFAQTVNGTLYFMGDTAATGSELWKIDPVAGIAVLVKDISPGLADSRPAGFTSFQGVTYLLANDADHGFEIWRTDGSEAGTVRVTDLYPTLPWSFPDTLEVVGNTLFFQVHDRDGRVELWKTDGTSGGETLVRAFTSANYRFDEYYYESYLLQDVIAIGDTLYFTAFDEEYGRELWKSDGTVDGTVLVKDIWPGPDANRPSQMLPIGDRLYFLANDGIHGQELWQSDGTAAGTFMHGEVSPGPRFGPIWMPKVIGNTLFLVAETFAEGVELWSLTLNSAPTAIALDAASVTENTAAGQVVGRFTTTDPDVGDSFTYDLVPGTGDAGNSLFAIVGNELRVAALLDRELQGSYSIRVRSSDSELRWVESTFTITLLDVNEFDVTPLTDTDESPNEIPENAPDGTPVGLTAFARDRDGTNNGVTYSLFDDAFGRFQIDSATGVVTVKNSSFLNYETTKLWDVIVRAVSDDGSEALKLFVVSVLDVDEFDVGPVVDSDSAPNLVSESSVSSTPVGITAFASDADGTTNAITYSLIDSAGGRFLIDAETGIVSTADDGVFDYETATAHTIRIRATSEDGSVSDQSFTIQVTDVDEFNVSPIVDNDPAPNRVLEHSPAGTPVGYTAFASDMDGTNNGVTYSLWNTRGGRFAIDPVTGVVTVANGEYLDREVTASWSLTVLAISQDGSVSVKEFAVDLVDVDEFNVGKVFDLDPAPNTIVENAPNGTPVGITGFGIDLDETNSTVTYSLWNTRAGRFAIDPTTGVVTVANGALIDREAQGTWTITILATSSDGSISVKEFAIAVQDVDEHNVGKVFDLDPAPNSVVEHAASGTPVGITGFGIDLDATQSAVTYSLWNTRGGRFAIDPATGVVTVANGAILDREVAAAWTITILATSQDGSVSVRDFTITVQDVDEFDVGQVFDLDSNPNSVAENAANGTAVGIRGFGIDLDATTNVVTYLLADDAGGRFAIDSVSGVVTVANTSLLDWEAVKSWAITIRATSADGSESSRTFWITLLDVVD